MKHTLVRAGEEIARLKDEVTELKNMISRLCDRVEGQAQRGKEKNTNTVSIGLMVACRDARALLAKGEGDEQKEVQKETMPSRASTATGS